MEKAGCEIVVMEVASQGLKLHRTQGFTFELGIFTNLEPDHIGPNEHADFAEYRMCKGLLFKQCRHGIVNKDDENLEELLKGHTCTIETYGFDKTADLYAEDLELVKKPGELGIDFMVKSNVVDAPADFRVEVPTPGISRYPYRRFRRHCFQHMCGDELKWFRYLPILPCSLTMRTMR